MLSYNQGINNTVGGGIYNRAQNMTMDNKSSQNNNNNKSLSMKGNREMMMLKNQIQNNFKNSSRTYS